jgi:hypothetical protein
MVQPTYDEKKIPPCDGKWWPPIQPCGWGTKLKDEGRQDLDVEEEATMSITYGNSILI